MLDEDLLKKAEEFCLLGVIMGSLNSDFLTFIPKSEWLASFVDYRPFSLCNGVYKIITKIITYCLKPHLSRYVLREQFGFFKDWFIHEEVG